MPIRHRCWDEPGQEGDGFKVLICRYRPRALRKENETWDKWLKVLGPSEKLHADFYGKNGLPINWETYRKRYLDEMKESVPRDRIAELAKRVAAGETVTLLCSKACTNAKQCHRTLLKALIEAEVAAIVGGSYS